MGVQILKDFRKLGIFLTLTFALVVMLAGSVAAQSVMPSNNNTTLQVVNDNGARMNDSSNNEYTFYPGSASGGLNAVKITDDSSNPATGKVVFTNSQSGTFYTTYTGTKAYSDDGILMLAVNGTIPSNFQVNIKASGYQWIPTTDGSIPLFSDISYNATTLDETFYKSDFIYGPQTWKPYYKPDYPLFEKEDMANTNNKFNIMLIDLYAGMLKYNNYPGITLTNNGTIKIEFSFQNLPKGSLAAFNIYAFANAAGNQPVGVSWTNEVNTVEQTSTTTSGYYVNGNSTPVVTSTNPVNNAFNVAVNKIIKINFNLPIKFSNNVWIELYSTATGAAKSFKSSISGNVLSLIPSSPLAAGTKYTVIIHSKSITDLLGNALAAPYTTRFTTTLPPVVTSTSPVNNAVNVAVNKVIQINFSKAIQLGTNPWIELKNQYGTAKPFTTSINGSILNITSNTTFARGTTYTVILHSNSVTSTGGAGLAAPYTTKFTTTTT